MIEEFTQKHVDVAVHRLAALPQEAPAAALLRRGVDPRSVAASVAAIDRTEVEFNPEQVVDAAFTPSQHHPTPFPPGRRFGDGQWATYYSALEEDTCVAELRHYRQANFVEGEHFALVSCRLRGTALFLLGHETAHPELVSLDKSGYPFCQALADEARRVVDALHTPSARHRAGTSVPIFNKAAISDATTSHYGRFERSPAGDLAFKPI